MKKEAGLWLDHKRAVVVILHDHEEDIQRITSNVGKHVRYSGASHPSDASESHNDTSESGRDRRFDDQLDKYYDKVIACIGEVDSILILGPGEAKVEFEKRFGVQKLAGRVVSVETSDKMTDREIAAKVRQHFRK